MRSGSRWKRRRGNTTACAPCSRAHEILQSRPPVEFRHIQALYGELGAEAMKETAEWVAIYRQRPIRPP